MTSQYMKQAIQRFWSKVNKNGRIKIAYKTYFAHRFAWIITNGPIPPNKFVCHKCDNPPCVQPSHLFLGSPRDNSENCIIKGRSAKGTKNSSAKLTEDMVKEIRQRVANGESRQSIAPDYNVSKGTVGYIILGTHWSHVP